MDLEINGLLISFQNSLLCFIPFMDGGWVSEEKTLDQIRPWQK